MTRDELENFVTTAIFDGKGHGKEKDITTLEAWLYDIVEKRTQTWSETSECVIYGTLVAHIYRHSMVCQTMLKVAVTVCLLRVQGKPEPG